MIFLKYEKVLKSGFKVILYFINYFSNYKSNSHSILNI
jgi:hypothetical protein